LERLAPHFRRFLNLYQTLYQSDKGKRRLENVLDQITAGIFIVDADMRVVFLNRFAEEFLRAGDGITMRQKRLTVSDPIEHNNLQTAVSIAAGRNYAVKNGAESGLSVTHRRAGSRNVVTVTPLRDDSIEFRGHGGTALIVVQSANDLPDLNFKILQDLFQLTGAEYRVAAALAAGLTTTEIATKLGIGGETVRSHLKAIYAKTNTRRQSQLVAVLTNLSKLTP
tara:strand:+ start:1148 stop:1819 length:672 start_codon:yes stop_codon:yes gene_type:complete